MRWSGLAALCILLLMPLTGVSKAEQKAPAGQWPPYVTMRDPYALYIRWKTAEPSRDTLTLYEEGVAEALGTFSEEVSLRFHSVLLEGLMPSAALRYRIEGTRNTGMEGRLVVPRQAEETTFLVMSDTLVPSLSGVRDSAISRGSMLVDAMAGEKPPVDFLVHTGNLVASGAMAEYDGFFRMIGPLSGRMPLFAVKGNQDGRTGLFDDAFSFPMGGRLYGTQWHHFDTKNALFVFLNLDFNSTHQASQTVQWLDAVLETFKDRKWKFVFTHRPFYSSAGKGGNVPMPGLFETLFMKHGVDVVFSGRQPAYQRILRKGVVYIVSGGGGGPGYAKGMEPEFTGTVKTVEETLHYLRGQIRGDTFLFQARRVGVESTAGTLERSEGEMDRFVLHKP
ncbi:MAG: metallophosphoesterase [Thermodesulfobacteriota bacterium]